MNNPLPHSIAKIPLAAITLLTLLISSKANEFTKISPASESVNQTIINRIACGSCYRATSKNKEVWSIIAADNPQLFLFMGDNIYADTRDMEKMKKSYAQLNNLPSYQKFSSERPVLPIWDDHDYGENDAGKDYPKKVESQQIFLDHYNFPKDHPARKQAGIYHSYYSGPEGKRLQVINLDTRYHRSNLKQKKIGKLKAYLPTDDPNATLLGAEQWKWLENELNKPADMRIIVSSIQIITVNHRYEKWANMPTERKRFFQLLKKTQTKNLILLSGDRHLAEFSQIKPDESGLDFPLIEMTSSGLTHANAWDNGNSHRIEDSYFNKRNYGTIDIDWTTLDKPKVTLQIMKLGDQDAEIFRKKVIQF